jgi:hypothetical protein
MDLIASFQQYESMRIWPFIAVLIVVLTVLAIPTSLLIKWAWARVYVEKPRPKNWILILFWATYTVAVTALVVLAIADDIMSPPPRY